MTELLPPGHVFAGLKKHHYRCVLIDPPTKFVAGTKGRPQHYDRMTDHQIAALPVADLLHPDGAFIFLWVTSPKLYRPKGCRTRLRPDELADTWGAKWSGRAFVWIKLKRSKALTYERFPVFENRDLHIGTGFTTRKNAEDCLLFKTGEPDRLARDVHEVIIAPARQHSRKPDEAMLRIERFCAGPRVELFAREQKPNWDCWGNETEKFNTLAEAA